MPSTNHPKVVVIGAGPVGLASAAHLVEDGANVTVLEAGDEVGSSIRAWGHVRLFSPWRYTIDAAAAGALSATGWQVPDLDHLPTGNELVDQYLAPVADTPALHGRIRLGSRVTDVARVVDKVKDDRTGPFLVRFTTAADEEQVAADAVIDASGTWTNPNPAGGNGLPALGEPALGNGVTYGIPDVLGVDRDQYAGRTVAVVGSGHSAANVLLSLVALRAQDPETVIHWLIRGRVPRAYGGGSADELEARGRLGTDTMRAVESGDVVLHDGFHIDWFEAADASGRVRIHGADRAIEGIDRVVVATGQRPELSLTRELRVDLDPALESTIGLAPLIDPNVHSCGTVRPHAYQQLTHPEPGFYTIGAKSYGRAPTFLLATGYEQARSLSAHLTGDEKRATTVSLVLPESGVCNSTGNGDGTAGACCGPTTEAVTSLVLQPHLF